MSPKHLRSSTALALGLALTVMPLSLVAQETEMPACGEDVPFPCVDAEGTVVQSAPDENPPSDGATAPPDEAPPSDPAMGTPDQAPSPDPETGTPDDSAIADEPPPPEVTPEPPPEPDSAPEPPASGSETPVPEDAPQPGGDPAEPGEEAAAPMPDDATPDAAAPEAPVADEAAPDAPAPEAPAPDAAPDGALPEAPEAPAEPEAPAASDTPEPIPAESPEPSEPPSATDDPAPEQPATEAPADESPAQESDAPRADDPAPEPQDTETEAPEAADGDDAPTPTAPPPRQADPEPDRDAAPPSAAAREGAEPVETTSEEVTEDGSRDSTEDFDTRIAGDSAADDDDSEDGLSTFERAILLGLGAVAVGSILDGGGEVVANSGDRIVVERDGDYVVLKNDDAILSRPGNEVRTQTFEDGSTRTTVTRQDGVEVVTLRAPDGTTLRRVRILPDGTRIVIFDDTGEAVPVDTAELPAPPQGEARRLTASDVDALREALAARDAPGVGRDFSLRQIRRIYEVRALAAEVELDAINFETGSAAIRPAEAEELALLGRTMAAIIDEDPDAVFLVEGHTDAVGNAAYNLALSDRRAESVALALVEYFDVPPENLVTQGYGESQLRVETQSAERANRRAVVRNITPLLR